MKIHFLKHVSCVNMYAKFTQPSLHIMIVNFFIYITYARNTPTPKVLGF